MKTNFSIGTATVAIAMSLSSAAHASEESAIPVIETEVVISAENPDRWNDSNAQLSALGYSAENAATALDVVEMSIPQIAAPVSIDPNVQQAIYDVNFLADAGEGLVNLPVLAPVETELTFLNAPFEIDGAIQQAIFDVNFLDNGGEGQITITGPVADPMTDGVVTLRGLTSNSLNANYGDIDAFYGDIVAFYGDIDAFWGDINPFYGDIDAFYGDIGAFWGDISPFYGDITAFWGDIDAFWGDIVAFDAASLQSLGDFWKANSTLISQTEESWNAGDFAGASTNLTALKLNALRKFGANGFTDSDADAIFARHGVDPDDHASLALLSAGQRAAFFMDWHDTVNTYSGVDAVDHWMGAINWTPSITQMQSEHGNTVVGVIDAAFGAADGSTNNLIYQSGSNTKLNGHGSAVASLLFAPHDGEGVMGIAPNASVTAYNPFAFDGTATWFDVQAGILAIKGTTIFNSYLGEDRKASVINLSLGESGFVAAQGLSNVFSNFMVRAFKDSTVYVVAAGNDGVAQTTDVEWDFTTKSYSLLDPTMDPLKAAMLGYPAVTESTSDTAAIFVGSLGLDGQISHFSNTPGDACLLDNGVCHAGNELKNFFIVAPGELLLVDDGYGGVTRASGTSFAAPLVSGAIALLHDRWPWLADNPQETTEIIFRSAKDLGAPGVDAVYGHGLLDVVASQSPLDFGLMTFNLWQKKGKNYRESTITADKLLAEGGVPSWWETNDVFFTAFEDIGGTFRDFAIPMSSFTYGKRTNTLGNGYQKLQDFVSDRFANWLLSGGADKDGDGTLGVSQVRSNIAETRGQWTMRFDAMAPRLTQDGAVRPVHNAATLTTPDGKASFTLGHGQGALAFSGGQFGIKSDHNAQTGGVNPVLGLASGEVFGGASYNITEGTKLSFGYSAEREDWEDLDFVSELDRQIQRQLGAREAEALTLSVDQSITDRFSVGVQFTHLDEADALLGAQTGNDTLLGEGSRTDAMTVSASYDAGNGLSFDLSMTGGATATNDGQLFATSERAISSAGQFAVNKRGVMNSRDILRVSVGQPLTVERGELEFTSDQVVNRQTGEIGAVTQTIGIDTKRRFTSEFVYATPVSDAAEFGLIGRYVSAGGQNEDESFMLGANFGLRF